MKDFLKVNNKDIFSLIDKFIEINSKKVYYIPFKKNGVVIDKVMKVVDGSELYKKLIEVHGKLPVYFIEK